MGANDYTKSLCLFLTLGAVTRYLGLFLTPFAYLGYCELPSKSTFLLVHPSHLLNDVHIRPAFGLDENERR